jgi:hydroxymethylpyrimidine pyrophosphatase-like HAD family hydrolase
MKLIVLDCDGVISKGEAAPFEPGLLARLAKLNRLARENDGVPAVTVNTGRPSPYVEAVMQAIDGYQPALYESGAGLYFPESYRFEISPLWRDDQRRLLEQIIAEVDQHLVQTGQAYWQPGKTVCFTLFALSPTATVELSARVREIVTRYPLDLQVSLAKLAINIHPVRINKGTGLLWLAQQTGIDPAEMVGVGDTAGDLDFLRLVGYAAAPTNAIPEVKAVAAYVSSYPDAAGLHDILDQLGLG